MLLRPSRSQEADADAIRRAEESLRSIEAGGLPLAARERLAKLRGEGPGFYSTDLTTQEFLLLRQSGFRPITQVMGSCFYNVGWQYTPGGFGYGFGRAARSSSSTRRTQAWQEARRLALSPARRGGPARRRRRRRRRADRARRATSGRAG